MILSVDQINHTKLQPALPHLKLRRPNTVEGILEKVKQKRMSTDSGDDEGMRCVDWEYPFRYSPHSSMTVYQVLFHRSFCDEFGQVLERVCDKYSPMLVEDLILSPGKWLLFWNIYTNFVPDQTSNSLKQNMFRLASNASSSPGILMQAAKNNPNVHHGWTPSVIDQTVLSNAPPVGAFSLVTQSHHQVQLSLAEKYSLSKEFSIPISQLESALGILQVARNPI